MEYAQRPHELAKVNDVIALQVELGEELQQWHTAAAFTESIGASSAQATVCADSTRTLDTPHQCGHTAACHPVSEEVRLIRSGAEYGVHKLVLLDDAILHTSRLPNRSSYHQIQQIERARTPVSCRSCHRAHLVQAVADLLVEFTKRIHLVHGDCAVAQHSFANDVLVSHIARDLLLAFLRTRALNMHAGHARRCRAIQMMLCLRLQCIVQWDCAHSASPSQAVNGCQGRAF